MKYWEPIEDNKMRFRAHDEFIKANGFTKYFLYSNQKSIEKILKSGTFASFGITGESEDVPYLDHGIIYKNHKTKVCCLVYMPYSEPSMVREKVNEWAKAKGLKAEVYDKSWYNSTCLVIISLPYVNIAFK